LIGTDSDSSPEIGSRGAGILVKESSNNTIGGTFRENGNVILGSSRAGVLVTGTGSTGNTRQHNFIGTDRDFAISFPNGGGGVVFERGAHDNLLGGKAFVGVPGTPAFRGLLAGNVMVENTGWGVSVAGGVGNQILNNLLIGNAAGPIQLIGGGKRLLVPPEGVFDGTRVTGSVEDLVSTPAGSLVQIFSGNSAFSAANYMSEGVVQADGSFDIFTGPAIFGPVVTMTITSSADDSTSTLGRTRFPIENPGGASVDFRLGSLNSGGVNELDSESGNQAVMALEVEGRNVGALIEHLSLAVSGTLVDQDLANLGVVALWHDRNNDGVLGFGDIELDRITPSGNGSLLEFSPDFQIEVNEME
jgi:hypothetical protein